MNRRRMLTLISTTFALLVIALPASNAVAQSAADVDAVKVASKGFYTALAALDGGTAMGKVWANTPYVTYVGPRDKSITVGWDAQKQIWANTDKTFSQRNVTLTDQHIHVVGNLAWEMGQETGGGKRKDGTETKTDWFATNVYEKIDGHWLMVSHHVQPKPQ